MTLGLFCLWGRSIWRQFMNKRSPLAQHRNSPRLLGLEIFSREGAKARRKKERAKVMEINCRACPGPDPGDSLRRCGIWIQSAGLYVSRHPGFA